MTEKITHSLNESEIIRCFGSDLLCDTCLIILDSVFSKAKAIYESQDMDCSYGIKRYLEGKTFSVNESGKKLLVVTDVVNNGEFRKTIVGSVTFLTSKDCEFIHPKNNDEQDLFSLNIDFDKKNLCGYKGKESINCLIMKTNNPNNEKTMEGFEEYIIYLPEIEEYCMDNKKQRTAFKVKKKINSLYPESKDLHDYILFLNEIEARKKYESDNVLFITPNALKEIDHHIHWGEYTEDNILEQGGYMIGYICEWDYVYYVLVTDVLPFTAEVSSSTYFETTIQSVADTMATIRNINEKSSTKKYRIGTFHTHPGELDVFMSRTDKATQRRLFSNDWQFSVVINPQKKICKAYNGSNADEARCIFIIDENQNKEWVNKFKDAENSCIGWNKWRSVGTGGILEKQDDNAQTCDLLTIKKSILEFLRVNFEYSYWLNRFMFVICAYIAVNNGQSLINRFELVGVFDKHGTPLFANKNYSVEKDVREKTALVFVYTKEDVNELINHFASIKTDYYMTVERPNSDNVTIIETNGI